VAGDFQKLEPNATHYVVILIWPTPLKTDEVEKIILWVAQKDSRSSSYPHVVKHERAPGGTIAWWTHTRGPRSHRGTIVRGTITTT